jgi:hypothetical protein
MERKVSIVNKGFYFFVIDRLCLGRLTASCQDNPENEEQRNSNLLIHNLIVNVVRVIRRELAECKIKVYS